MSEKTDNAFGLFKEFYELVLPEKKKYEKAFQAEDQTRTTRRSFVLDALNYYYAELWWDTEWIVEFGKKHPQKLFVVLRRDLEVMGLFCYLTTKKIGELQQLKIVLQQLLGGVKRIFDEGKKEQRGQVKQTYKHILEDIKLSQDEIISLGITDILDIEKVRPGRGGLKLEWQEMFKTLASIGIGEHTYDVFYRKYSRFLHPNYETKFLSEKIMDMEISMAFYKHAEMFKNFLAISNKCFGVQAGQGLEGKMNDILGRMEENIGVNE
jgi:hypothetical protein